MGLQLFYRALRPELNIPAIGIGKIQLADVALGALFTVGIEMQPYPFSPALPVSGKPDVETLAFSFPGQGGRNKGLRLCQRNGRGRRLPALNRLGRKIEISVTGLSPGQLYEAKSEQ